MYQGGFADVWKGEYCGQDVAVKVIRTYSNSDSQKMIGVSGWLLSLRVCALTVPHVEVLQGGCDMEIPPASKCPAAGRSDDVRGPACNGVGLDGERKHQ